MVSLEEYLNHDKYKKLNKNVFKITKELELIKKEILKFVPAVKIILFGSYAYGKPNDRSDIDIYVIAENKFRKNAIYVQADIVKNLYESINYDIDIKIRKKSNFESRVGNCNFENVLESKGVIIYEKKVNEICINIYLTKKVI
jgi:predicted nucleotidyltransferase